MLYHLHNHPKVHLIYIIFFLYKYLKIILIFLLQQLINLFINQIQHE